MKKLYTIVILFTLGITTMFAQNCFECNPTTKAFSIGASVANGNNSFAGGNESETMTTADNSFVFGDNSLVTQSGGIAIGSNLFSNATNSLVFGRYLTSTGSNSITMGMGSSSSSQLINSKPNSLMFGVTSLPSLTIVKPDGAALGYVGIGTDDPQEMAHVVGTLLIERTEEVASSLQFKHPMKRGLPPEGPQMAPYYWDIYSDTYGLKFNTAGSNGIETQRMIISAGGSVGIGIDAPKAKLHVDQNILAEGNITTLKKFVFTPEYNANSEYWEISRTSAGLNYAYMEKRLQDVLFLGNDGNIGVGKTDPASNLDVNGSFKAQSANIVGNAFILGNLGIGSATSRERLHVNDGNILISKDLSKSNSSPLGALIFDAGLLPDHARGSWGIEYLEADDTGFGGLNFWKATKSGSGNQYYYSLCLDDAGSVGIGNRYPQATLDVTGSFAAQSAEINGLLKAQSATIASITGNTTVTGTLTANVLNAQSATINGKIKTKEVEVTLSPPWPDFVFENDYKLLPLCEVEQHIKENKHLPNVPSAAEVEANGINLGEMNAILIQKVEELTLYILDLQKQINELKTK